ncbi:MAG: hypothetical protein NTV97_22460 [Alphaproteobacteria bacterium]|nr:hypothetical protein [Alphaproteobacteria bacterium]
MRAPWILAVALAGACSSAPVQDQLPEPSRAEVEKSCIEAATGELKRLVNLPPTRTRTRSADSGKRTVELEVTEAGQKQTYVFSCGIDPLTNKAYAASMGKKKEE